MHLDLYSVVSPERTSSATQLYSTTQVCFLDMGRITLPFPLALEVGPLPSLCLALPVAVVNVTVVVGQTAVLPCSIEHLANFKVRFHAFT